MIIKTTGSGKICQNLQQQNKQNPSQTFTQAEHFTSISVTGKRNILVLTLFQLPSISSIIFLRILFLGCNYTYEIRKTFINVRFITELEIEELARFWFLKICS